MSSTHTLSKVLNDTNVFVDYLRNTLQSPIDLRYDGTNVTLTFVPALSAGNQTLLSTLVANYVDPDTRDTANDCNISAYNCSSTPLVAAAVFTGTWEDASRFTSVSVSVIASTSSASLGLQLQFGVSSPQVDASNSYTYSTVGTAVAVTAAVAGRYFRVEYTNGDTTQTAFDLSSFWSVTECVPVGQLSAPINEQRDVALMRSVLMARGDNVLYSTMRADEQSQLRGRLPTNFDRIVVAESVPIIQLSFNYLVNTDETKITLSNAGTVTYNAGRAAVNSGAAANSFAYLQTNKYCRCSSGNKLHMLFGAAFATPANGSTQFAGGGDAANGLFFGYLDATFGAWVRSNNGTFFTAATNFNVDKLDGTGPSGILLNPLLGNTYAISFDSTGYGSVCYYIVAPTAGTSSSSTLLFPDCVLVHRISFANISRTTGLFNSQFPCGAYSANTGSTTQKTVYVSSFCAFTDGPSRRPMLLRTVDSIKTVNSITYVPHICLQNKAAFNGVPNSTTVHLRQLDVATAGTALRNMYVAIIMNPTFTTAGTYADVNGANSCVSASTTATMAITAGSGITLWTGLWYLTARTWELSDYDIMLAPRDICCLACKSSLAGNSDISLCITFGEFQ